MNPDISSSLRRPLREMLAGRLAGDRDFEDLLERRIKRAGAENVDIADILETMGVSLYLAAFDKGDENLEKKAMDFLRRAVGAYKNTFGADDPEVALALDTYATAAINTDPQNPASDADSALEDAYRIRASKLGPRDPETGDALAGLAQVTGLPSRTGGDPAKITRAAALFDQAIGVAQFNEKDKPDMLGFYYFQAAAFRANYDDAEDALALLEKCATAYSKIPDVDYEGSKSIGSAASYVAERFDKVGDSKMAEHIRSLYSVEIAEFFAHGKTVTRTVKGSN